MCYSWLAGWFSIEHANRLFDSNGHSSLNLKINLKIFYNIHMYMKIAILIYQSNDLIKIKYEKGIAKVQN